MKGGDYMGEIFSILILINCLIIATSTVLGNISKLISSYIDFREKLIKLKKHLNGSSDSSSNK